MTKGKIAALFFLACCAPPLACAADSVAHSRVKKAAEYRDAKDSVEPSRKSDPAPGTEEKLPDVSRDRQPANDRESVEKMLEGLLKSGEFR